MRRDGRAGGLAAVLLLLLPLGAPAADAPAAPSAKPAPAVVGLAQLRGRLCNWGDAARGSSYGHGSWLDFDGTGRLSYTSEPSFGGDAVLAYGQEGDDSVGGSYRIVDKHVYIRLDDGTTVTARVRQVAPDGHISELRINGNRYAAELCK